MTFSDSIWLQQFALFSLPPLLSLVLIIKSVPLLPYPCVSSLNIELVLLTPFCLYRSSWILLHYFHLHAPALVCCAVISTKPQILFCTWYWFAPFVSWNCPAKIKINKLLVTMTWLRPCYLEPLNPVAMPPFPPSRESRSIWEALLRSVCWFGIVL